MEDKGRLGEKKKEREKDRMPRGKPGTGKPKPCGEIWEVPNGAVTTVHRCGVDLRVGHTVDLHICRRDNCDYSWPVKEKINAGDGNGS